MSLLNVQFKKKLIPKIWYLLLEELYRSQVLVGLQIVVKNKNFTCFHYSAIYIEIYSNMIEHTLENRSFLKHRFKA